MKHFKVGVDRRLVNGVQYKYHRASRMPLPAHIPEDSPEFADAFMEAERALRSKAPYKPEGAVISGVLRRARERSARKGYDFNLSEQWFYRELYAQNSRCAVSGIKFSYERIGKKMPYAPSIDRKDCSLGYTPENCRIVCSVVNLARLDWGDDVFGKMCESVVRQNKRRIKAAKLAR